MNPQQITTEVKIWLVVLFVEHILTGAQKGSVRSKKMINTAGGRDATRSLVIWND